MFVTQKIGSLQRHCVSFGQRFLHNSSRVPRVGDRYRRHLRVNNYGYTWNFHTPGEPMPRIKGCTQEISQEEKKFRDDDDPWSKENALLGQNDYIDLLGDGSVHPSQLLYHIPPWLRGFPGEHRANELLRLIHYRNIFNQKLKRTAPRRWHELMKQIQFLLKYNNHRKQDEIRLERKLGLWDDQSDYFFKDTEKRTYKDLP